MDLIKMLMSLVSTSTSNKKVVFLILYVDDILLIGNDVESLSKVKGWLANQFQMKDLGEASYVLGIQLIRDRKNKLLALSQASYIDKILNAILNARTPRKVIYLLGMEFTCLRNSVLKHLKKLRI
jgi:hypothetical protein